MYLQKVESIKSRIRIRCQRYESNDPDPYQNVRDPEPERWEEPMRPMPSLWLEHPQKKKKKKKTKLFTVKGRDCARSARMRSATKKHSPMMISF